MADSSAQTTGLFYTLSPGEGPTVLLIHGAGGSRLVWPAELRRLPGATVLTVDLPGHGRSPGDGRERIEDYAADLIGLLNEAVAEPAVLVGHSMGGAIAQVIALTAPDRVAGLVLLATAARLRVAPAILEGLQRDPEGTVRLISEWAWGPGTDPEQVARGEQLMLEAGPELLRRDFLACDRFDIRDRVDRIACPTLVLVGSEDRMTPPRFGQWLAERISGAQHRLIEGAGHMLMVERPGEVADAVASFLAGIA